MVFYSRFRDNNNNACLVHHRRGSQTLRAPLTCFQRTQTTKHDGQGERETKKAREMSFFSHTNLIHCILKKWHWAWRREEREPFSFTHICIWFMSTRFAWNINSIESAIRKRRESKSTKIWEWNEAVAEADAFRARKTRLFLQLDTNCPFWLLLFYGQSVSQTRVSEKGKVLICKRVVDQKPHQQRTWWMDQAFPNDWNSFLWQGSSIPLAACVCLYSISQLKNVANGCEECHRLHKPIRIA